MAASTLRFALPAFLLLAACSHGSTATNVSTTTTGGNGAAQPTVGATQTAPAQDQGDLQQVIAEADIVQLSGGTLYALSDAGTLTVIDVSKPGQLSLLGEIELGNAPFEMYLLANDRIAVMSTDAAATNTLLTIVDAHAPEAMTSVQVATIAGAVVDSRLVGSLLYLVTSSSFGLVATYDLSSPTPGKIVDSVSVAEPVSTLNFGNGRLYLGEADGIDLVDVSDASGKLAAGSHIPTQGAITERWQMSEQDSVLRVVSQGATVTSPVIETFQIWNNRTFQAMGNAVLTMPSIEQLRAVSFDATRAYAITYQHTDPLYLIDLSNPAQPVPRGQLTLDGYMFYLEPHGNRLIGLGVNSVGSTDSLNVSLFDVTDLDHPGMLSRVTFGGYAADVPEDQDRIQKAFKVSPSGLVTVPFLPEAGASCTTGGGVQLVDWSADMLVKDASLPVAGNPRRALLNDNELIAVSDSNVTAFDLTNRVVPTQTADLVVGACQVRSESTAGTPVYAGTLPGDAYDSNDTEGDGGGLPCSVSHVGAGGHRGWATVVIGLGLALGALARRRRA